MSERKIFAECSDCDGTFKGCTCKKCSKCTTLFKCYLGTSIPKTRSHCRYCGAAICPSCLLSGIQPIKSCNPCHVAHVRKVQKGQDALISLSVESSGLPIAEDNSTVAAEENAPVSPTMSFKEMSVDEQHIWLTEAVRKGNHSLISMLLDSGASVDLTDTSGNPILFNALRHGHLACVALMMERGVDIHCCNVDGNTALHIVGRYGNTAQHVECCDMLVQMGADVFTRNSKHKTALDLAVRHDAHPDIVRALRQCQLSQSLVQLQETLHLPPAASVKYGDLHRSIACVVDYLTLPEDERGLAPAMAATQSPSPAITETVVPSPTRTPVDSPPSGRKRNGETKGHTRQSSGNISCPSSPAISRAHSPVGDRTAELAARVQQLTTEKLNAEHRCQSLVETVARSAQHTEERIRTAQREMEQMQQTHKDAVMRLEALNTNKITKLRADCDTAVFEADQRCLDAERSYRDLNVLQQGLKLTWIPDEFVTHCMNSKCRASFSQLVRRHHCRSCGRIYCKPCLANCVALPMLGYQDAVKICSTCFALVDEMFSPPST
ncbi:uncharacterized protein LOC135831101 [Sycon ciliatum]|uniref:uncharacterized protein LOC135831101 n=1 Tax=Sycon ciliatum TaxID=27933 RepID=UPI0031F680D8